MYGYCLDDPVNNVDPAGLEGHPSGGYYPAVPRWDWDEEVKRSKEREQRLTRDKEIENETGFWDGAGGRIVKRGILGAIAGAMEGAAIGTAAGSPVPGIGNAVGAVTGGVVGAPVGMLWGVADEVFFNTDEDSFDPQGNMMDHRNQVQK